LKIAIGKNMADRRKIIKGKVETDRNEDLEDCD
jgi:hypothetical protein